MLMHRYETAQCGGNALCEQRILEASAAEHNRETPMLVDGRSCHRCGACDERVMEARGDPRWIFACDYLFDDLPHGGPQVETPGLAGAIEFEPASSRLERVGGAVEHHRRLSLVACEAVRAKTSALTASK